MPRRESGRVLVLLLLFMIGLIALVFVGLAAFRAGPPPVVAIRSSIPGIGKRTAVSVTATEPVRGLSRVTVDFVQGDRIEKLAEKSYAPRSPWLPWGSKTESDTIAVEVGRDTLKGLKSAPATIRVTAERAPSWLRRPSPSVKELTLPVRLTPPSLQPLSIATYVTQGGSEAVVYRAGETSVRDGVRAGTRWFPGFPLPGGGKQDRFALFAVPYDMGDVSKVRLVAADDVGNESEVAFIDKFFPKLPSARNLDIDDAFMSRVVPAIMSQTPDLADKGGLLENFLAINGELRKANAATLVEMARSSKPEFLWTKTFLPMLNAAVMAHFADRRSYVYRGRNVDQQYHLGLDLAATRAVAVPSANDGVVILAKFFGIYGNTVVVDHGYGLMSLYGHLSSIDVKEGQQVKRGETVGRSGDTGLAGGDHLHFSILLQGLPVSPIEWWDGHWIRDRIARKLGAGFRFEG
jgi:hypothetical protein